MSTLIDERETVLIDSATKPQQQITALATAVVHVINDPKKLEDIDANKLKILYGIDKDMRAETARLAFDAAFERVQQQKTPVAKRAINRQIGNKYALLEDVVKMLDPVLLQNGFTYSFGMRECPHPAHVRIILTVRHSGGHTVESLLDAPLDDKGPKGGAVKTQLHGMGSSMRYCQRYQLCLFFSVTFPGEDDDGQAAGNIGPGADAISANQAQVLEALAQFSGTKLPLLHSVYAINAIPELPANLYGAARQMMMSKVGMTHGELKHWLTERGLQE